jgi:RNA polymerase sigma-70 factor (ECF subfamily)
MTIRTFKMTREQEPTDEGIRPLREGDPSSIDFFANVVREHWTCVYRFIYCVSGDSHDAEDLTQETFLRAWNRLDSFCPGSGMRAWLLKIASNAWRDVGRRRGRVAFSSLEMDLVGSFASPDHRLETAEQGELLSRALEQLSEMTRMVFHLRAQEELSFREIAEAVGTTEQGARWHMHQARAKLMKILAENLEP